MVREGVDELAPAMSPATDQFQFLGMLPREGVVTGIAIALDCAGRVDRHDLLEAARGSAGLPAKEHIATRTMHRPKVSRLRLAISRCQIAYGCFADLHVLVLHDLRVDLPID